MPDDPSIRSSPPDSPQAGELLSSRASETSTGGDAPQPVKVCGVCGSRFSGDARFCPFDGEALHRAPPGGRAEERDPLLGAVLDGRYELEGILGEGGMGTVYRARHRVLDKRLAVKVLRADLSRDADLGLRFLREAKAAASIAHPSVVQITDFGNLPSGQPYFVMELLAGTSLSTILRKGGPIPAARAVRLLGQMVDALSAAHAAGVVHRDLKPDNVLVCPAPAGEIVKVLDFGLAKVAGQSRLTKAGLVFGTPHYMSPEQASGGTVDERTDVYAIGIVMYEMFTGRVPFEADTYMGVLTKHLYVSPTPPSVLLGGVAELGALEQVTLRCLEKKAEKRYASMRALGDELSRVARFNDEGALTVKPTELREARVPRLADELELPTMAELRLSQARSGIPRRPIPEWLVPAIALGAVFALGAALVAVRSGSSPAPAAASPAPSTAAPLEALGRSGAERASPESRLPSRGLPAELSSPTATVSPGPSIQEVTPAGEPEEAHPGAGSSRPRRPRTSAEGPPPRPKPSTGKAKMVGGEIVNPWAE